MKRAFTLIELLVVMGIVVIMALVAMPTLKALSKNNGAAGSTNLVRSYLGSARSVAISQHCQAGVVFFEETAASAGSLMHSGQTAMQVIIEVPTQTANAWTDPNDGVSKVKNNQITMFTQYANERQYLPQGIAVASLNDDTSTTVLTAQNAAGATCRVILFDANGQMILRNGIGRPTPSGTPGKYPEMYSDWHLAASGTAANGAPANGVSAPGVLIFDQSEYKTESATLTTDAARSAWLKKNAQLLIVNAYTGGVIR